MTRSLHKLLILTGRAAARRRGSVLILCVALLVLIALIGTAWMSTVRTDLFASQQHTANTQIDLLVEGVKNMSKAVIAGSLFDNGATAPNPKFRTAEAGTNYRNYTAYDIQTTDTNVAQTGLGYLWLSPRVPNIAFETAPIDATPTGDAIQPGANAPMWLTIGQPLVGNTWESPFVLNAQGRFPTASPLPPHTYTMRSSDLSGSILLSPEYVDLQTSTGAVVRHPAWMIPDAISGGYVKYLAGDADGDGIADSGMFKLPVGDIDGLTYFAAVRIIDNNSAINVNTAWDRRADYAGDTTPTTFNPTFFPANVGLVEMLKSFTPGGADAFGSGTEMNDLNKLRWGWTTSGTFPPTMPSDSVPAGLLGATPTTPTNREEPRNDAGTGSLTSFNFLTIGDAMNSQLARRLDNPGHNYYGTSALPYKRLSISDSAALAYHFGLVNPDASKSTLETALTQSLYDFAPNKKAGSTILNAKAYDASLTYQWFVDSFNFATEKTGADTTIPVDPTTFMPRRTLLTADNPVSNLTPVKLPLDTMMATYNNTATMSFACKTSINTADFPELFRAFWSVMAEQGGASPFGTTAAPVDYYSGSKFQCPGANAFGAPGTPQAPLEFAAYPQDTHPQRMFRSSIRENRAANLGAPTTMPTAPATGGTAVDSDDALRFSPEEELKLRAAIAAQNTVSLRDPTAAPATVALNASTSAAATVQVTATIYGVLPQPYITEVYANNDTVTVDPAAAGNNPNGYIAIEIFNPSTTDQILIDATWQLATIDRSPTGGMIKSVTILAPFPGTYPIPPNGMLFVDNLFTGVPPGGRPGPVLAASYRPASSKLPPTGGFTVPSTTLIANPIPELGAAFGKELVILRP
ncbi:MAG: hypothetical protein ACREJC_06065, partial [Tepidisphaeraceae bacterium]